MPAPPAFFQRAAGVGIDDMVKMTRLEHEDMLKNLEQRFHSEIVYTHIGDIVISVNPFKNTGNSHPEVQEAYVKAGKRRETFMLPPHVYTMVGDAYDQLMGPMAGPGAKRSRSVLISGESGAGKTEAMKLCVSHLGAVSASDNGGKDSVAVRLMKTNPVMEPIGNAKTVRNNNSSRFGKHFDIQFNPKGSIIGALTSTYLLEKPRIIEHMEGERNYHVFYMLCKAPSEVRASAHLEGWHSYKLLAQKGTVANLVSWDDDSEFVDMHAALVDLGFTIEQRAQLYRIFAIVLHLGNVELKWDPNADLCTIANPSQLQLVADLMQVDPAKLEEAMTHTKIKIGMEEIEKKLNHMQASSGQDGAGGLRGSCRGAAVELRESCGGASCGSCGSHGEVGGAKEPCYDARHSAITCVRENLPVTPDVLILPFYEPGRPCLPRESLLVIPGARESLWFAGQGSTEDHGDARLLARIRMVRQTDQPDDCQARGGGGPLNRRARHLWL